MVLPVSDFLLPTSSNSTHETFGDLNFYMATPDHSHEINFMAAKEPKTLIRSESMEKEKQISVDPISLRESSRREASFNFMLPPVLNAPSQELLPPVMPAAKSQLISCSLPSSGCWSPRFSFTLLKKKWKHESQASPLQFDNLAGRHSSAHAQQTARQDIHLRRSKSCAEGRAISSADELDLWFPRSNDSKSDDRPKGQFQTETKPNKEDHMTGNYNMDPIDDTFKCGALCLYLPGFAKGKAVRPKKEVKADVGNVMSRTVSLEKFECGSWASSAIINDLEDGDSINLYFDLPLELIQTSVNDATSPVAAAFVFDKDRKGALKNCSAPRKSHESSRHVRFSTSSPTSHPTSPASCITPRLRKAREDFNAFLEAQSA